MKFLHTMIRVRDLDAALKFFIEGLGLTEVRRRDSERGRFTLVFLETGDGDDRAQIELTHNWDQEDAYTSGRNFGHLAFEVDNIYVVCEHLQGMGVTIARPPRDGRMAFVRSPDQISVELLQRGGALAPTEPWLSMGNTGTW
ncbi:MAG: VOC family protein [Myxococcota bacterium]|nr:VOC family protein [Myxococcota bacterium]